MKPNLTYKDSGVDIEAGNKSVDYIKPLAKKTNRKEVLSGVGGFSGLFAIPQGYKEPVLVSSTDGVGTKLKLAFKLNMHETVGVDLVAMCVNDLICCGAEPLFFLDYFACGKLSPEQVRDVVSGISDGCLQSSCTLLGGETAELPGFYIDGEYDLAGFSVGVVEKSKIIDGKNIKTNDVLIGLSSSGLHSNGYSLAQKVCFDLAGWDLNYKHPELSKPIANELLTPTIIYTKIIKDLISKFEIKGIANITGGGFTENIPRIFPENISCEINLSSYPRPKIFKILQEVGGIEKEEMLRTFNNGIGMVLIIDQKYEKDIIKSAESLGVKAYQIGVVQDGLEKVRYKGEFNDA